MLGLPFAKLKLKNMREQTTTANDDVTLAWVPTSKTKAVLASLLNRSVTLTGCTTSGVEHVHGKQDWVFTKRRNRLGNERENDEIKIHCDWKVEESIKVIQLSRSVWKVFFGTPRRGHTKRAKSSPSLKRASDDSLAQIMRILHIRQIGRASNVKYG